MITYPEHLLDFYMWSVLVVLFAAFTSNVQDTTLRIGMSLGDELVSSGVSKTGLQDAITPSWQNRNNLISIGLIVFYFGFSLFVFKWYVGIAVFVGTIFVAIPIASKLLMFVMPAKLIREFNFQVQLNRVG
ncbi:hypothetical protein BOV89_10635 [Solemya velum gill symbiont]|uniref:hypothetical protein n=1 Tax=Solemya velum gill symbiont TaxID=2340 RepID=UPI0009CD0805|nr:hypothetical protein [Solemya velum gill symbiont]OOY36777.1 hypothetical protein BOV89_10635 [Solemya velum gill symbiont]